MPRRLDNWLDSFLEWTLPRSEAPTSMIEAVGLSVMASVMRRNVFWPRSLMGSYDLFPNLFFILVAEPGVARKSTTVGYGEQLLAQLDGINISSTAVSSSKLIEDLAEAIEASMTVLPSELGSFMNISHESMYDLLTDLYDNKKVYVQGTRAHGQEKIENPCINFLAATTPKWVENQMPMHVIGGGFASRCIFVFEIKPRQRKMYYVGLDQRAFDSLEKDLLHDLAWLMEHVEGEFKHDSNDTRDWIEAWYVAQAEAVKDKHENLQGYHNRKHVHAHKMAALFSLAERDDRVISLEHFERALKFLARVEERMPRAFTAVGENPHGGLLLDVAEFMREHKTVPEQRLFTHFSFRADGTGLREVLQQLYSMEVVVSKAGANGRRVYHYKGSGSALDRVISKAVSVE